MERRTFLSAGSVSALALTTGYAPASTGSSSDGPTAVVEEYYRRASAAESREQFTAEVPDLTHSASPLPDVAAGSPSVFEGALRQELVSADIVAEDIDADAIRELSDFLAGSLSDQAVATLAESNAVVAVNLRSDEVIGGELTKEWFVAEEDGEWRLVWPGERDSPRTAVREFFREVKRAEAPGQLDELIDGLVAPSSPLSNVAAYTTWYFRGIQRRDLLGTEVVARGIDAGRIASEFGPATNWSSRSQLETLSEANAVVAASLRDDRLDIEEFEQEWLVAPTDGEWRVVWF